MPETEVFTATYKSDIDGHGLAGYWWFLSNGFDPSDVVANQEVVCDTAAMTATFMMFTRDEAGRRIWSEDLVREPVTRPIKYLPSIYGLQNAVSA